jgi:glucose 1-dehydrogenase
VHVPHRRRDDAVLSASFAGKVAIVTGGAGGMGRATALAFAAAGAKVAVSDITADAGEETAAMVRDAGGDAVFVQTDVADSGSVVHLVDETVSRFGALHCAVNAAAIELERVRLHELDDEVFDRIIAVNLRSVYLCMKYEVRAMLAGAAGGAIVNIASTNSFRPQPHQSAYTASKHGVLGMTKNAAVDYAGDGIRINAVCPGAIDTPMLRAAMERRGRDPQDTANRLSLFGRFGTPEEIAQACLWLCSDDSSFTTGHALAVDGGYLAR